MRTPRWFPVFLGAAALASCADLPPMTASTCGNAIVESDRGEDCDTYGDPAAGTKCRAPGAVGECRFDCSAQAGGRRTPCPAGWACGADALCRQPSGTFTALGAPVPAEVTRLALGDFDGDGRLDVLAAGESQVAVHFHDPNGALAGNDTIPNGLLSPAIGDLTGDGAADLPFSIGFPFGGGIGVMAGSPSQTLMPVAFPTISPPATWQLLVASVERAASVAPTPIVFTKETTAPGKPHYVVRRVPQPTTTQPIVLAELPMGPENLAADIVAANLDADPCKEIAFAFTGASAVYVVHPCKSDGKGGVAWNDAGSGDATKMAEVVSLPAGETIAAGLLAANLSADDYEDLIVGGAKRTHIAYGTKTHLASSPDAALPGGPKPDDAFAPYALPFSEFPLAAARLSNADGPLFVTSDGLWAGSAELPLQQLVKRSTLLGQKLWTEACIADLNRDGILDVAAGSNEEPGLDFFGGVGKTAAGRWIWNATEIPTRSGVEHFAVGDYDGDLVQDLALSEIGTHDPKASLLDAGDSPSVLFGRPAGPPEAPVSMGRLPVIQQMLGAEFAFLGPPHEISDLSVVSISGTQGSSPISVLAGRSDRLLLAPFGLSLLAQQLQGSPFAVAIGRTSNGKALDAAALAISLEKLGDANGPMRLWLAPGDGRGGFGTPVASDPIALPVGGKRLVTDTRLAFGDLDGDGRDEIALVMPSDKNCVLRIAHGEQAAGGLGLSVGPATTVAGTLHDDSELAIADIDDDGHPDLALLVEDDQQVGTLFVFWNDGHGGFDFAAPLALQPAGGESVRAFAWIQADTDPEREIVLATTAGVFLVDAGPSSTRSLAIRQLAGVPGGTAIAAGDLDGDGLDDLAIGTGTSVALYRGGSGR